MAALPVNHKALFDQIPVTRFLIEPEDAGMIVCEANVMACAFFSKPRDLSLIHI